MREGTHCFHADECPDETPADVRGGEPLRDPIVEYPNRRGVGDDDPVNGLAVIGGYVYRGSALPDLEGLYVFGDVDPGGRLFVAIPEDGDLWETRTLEIDDGPELDQLLSFGRDEDGELYVLGSGADGGGV